MAEQYERDAEYEEAISHYQEAGEMFKLEKYQSTNSTRCLIKSAELGSLMFDDEIKLRNSLKIFDEVGRDYLRNNLMRFSAKNLFVKAVMIFFLLEDDVGAEKSLDDYTSEDTSLLNSSEYKFLKQVIQAMRDSNREAFEKAAFELNKKMTLDKWWLSVLGKIKSLIKQQDNVVEDFNPL